MRTLVGGVQDLELEATASDDDFNALHLPLIVGAVSFMVGGLTFGLVFYFVWWLYHRHENTTQDGASDVKLDTVLPATVATPTMSRTQSGTGQGLAPGTLDVPGTGRMNRSRASQALRNQIKEITAIQEMRGSLDTKGKKRKGWDREDERGEERGEEREGERGEERGEEREDETGEGRGEGSEGDRGEVRREERDGVRGEEREGERGEKREGEREEEREDERGEEREGERGEGRGEERECERGEGRGDEREGEIEGAIEKESEGDTVEGRKCERGDERDKGEDVREGNGKGKDREKREVGRDEKRGEEKERGEKGDVRETGVCRDKGKSKEKIWKDILRGKFEGKENVSHGKESSDKTLQVGDVTPGLHEGGAGEMRGGTNNMKKPSPFLRRQRKELLALAEGKGDGA